MKRIIVNIVLIITSFVLQGTLFKALDFGNVSPNLLLITVVSLGLMRGQRTGLLSGFFSGLLCDVFLSPYMGFYAILYMYLGYMSGSFNKVFFPEDVKLPMGLIAGSDILYGLACYAFMFLLRGKLNFSYYLLHVCIPECIYTMVITVILYPVLLWINKLLEKGERKQEKKFV